MFKRCKHDWEETNWEYYPPIRNLEGRFSQAELHRILYGFTMVYLRCQLCGDVGERELTGKAR